MSKFAKEITIADGMVYIDGEEIPWYIARPEDVGDNGFRVVCFVAGKEVTHNVVWLPVLAERVVLGEEPKSDAAS